MKQIYAAVVLATVVRSVCGAAVLIRPESALFPAGPGDRVVMLDVYASNPDASENERLNAYTIALESPDFSPTGVRFVIPPVDPGAGTIAFPASSGGHPYVFDAYPGNGPVDPVGMSDYNTVLISAALAGTGQEVNLSDVLNGFTRVAVLVPADARPGNYLIYVNPEFTALGGAGSSIATQYGVGGLILPEPGTLGPLLVGATLALRRRRVGVIGNRR